MALIPCPECQKEVSTEALSCPQCAMPRPGRKEQENGHHDAALNTCPECKNVISKKAKMCPNCGAPPPTATEPVEEERQELPVAKPAEETWLCPHCGMPYTRKPKINKMYGLDSPSHLDENGIEAHLKYGMESQETRYRGGKSHDRSYMARRDKVKSPLWQEGGSVYDEMPRYPRTPKKWTAISVILVLVLLTVGAWALWEFKDLNGLEALVYWNM